MSRYGLYLFITGKRDGIKQRFGRLDGGKTSAVSLKAQKRLGTFKILLKKLVDDYVPDG